MQIKQMAMQTHLYHVFGQILVFKMQSNRVSPKPTKIHGRQAYISIQTDMAFETKIKRARHKVDHVYTSLFMAIKSDQQKIIIYHDDELSMAYIKLGTKIIKKEIVKSIPFFTVV